MLINPMQLAWLRLLASLLSLVLLSSSCAFTLSKDSPLAAFTERKWQMQDGLPEQVVQAFAQTADRYLWIGTTGGLLRFDGERFVLFDRENTPAFHENNVFCLLVASDRSLWVGMEGGGLLRYRDGAFRAFSSNEGLSNNFVRVLHEDRQGKIWVGTDDGLFLVQGEHLARMDNGGDIPLLAVHAIYEDKDDGLWIGGSRLLRLKAGELTAYELGGKGGQSRVKSIVQTRDGTVWVGTVSGLKKKEPDSPSFTEVSEVTGTVRFLHETSDGTLWIGTIGRGLVLYQNQRFSRMTAPDALPSNTLLNLYEDQERNIWIGTQGGMLRLSRTPVRTITLPDSSDADAETVYRDRDGDVWVAAVNLFRVHNGQAVPYRFPQITGFRIRNIFRDRSGALWIGTEGSGAYREVNGKLVHYSTKEGLVNNFVRAFMQSQDGRVWIATDEGVSRWSSSGITNYGTHNGLCYFSTRSLLEDRTGDVWIGTDRGLSRLHQGVFVSDAVTEALKNEKIWALHEDSDGGLWFGTRTGGLYRWRGRKLSHYTVNQGLSSNGIFELLEDAKGTMWISGPNGISAVSRHDLDALADGRSGRVAVTLYGVSDGLETIQMCGGEKPAGLLTREGEVWFPSSKGVLRVSADQLSQSKPLPVVIDQVVADGRALSTDRNVSLDPDNAKVEFHFGAVLLRSQERVRFRYMLDGFDKDWSEPSLDRVAHYTNLPPGRYHFRVAAFELSNPAQQVETSLDIVQTPHFYRTPWFIAGTVGLLGLIILMIYRLRVAQMHARFDAVLKERNRLAREMHDTLIQGCASVSALLEAHSSIGSNGNHSELLEYARTQLRSTIDEARDAVWNLRQTAEDAGDVSPLLREMTERLTNEFGIPVRCTVSGTPFPFDKAAMHDLLMITREALHNSLRHGHPSNIDVRVLFTDGLCSVEVVDNGAGFDLATQSNGDKHYGLTGVRERVERLHGTLKVTTKVGAGTSIKVDIPRKRSTSKAEVAS